MHHLQVSMQAVTLHCSVSKALCCYYSAPVGERRVLRSACLSVCLSVCEHLWNGQTDLHEIFVQIPCVRGSVLLWQHCDIRYVLPVLWMTSHLAEVSRMAMDGVAESDVYECLVVTVVFFCLWSFYYSPIKLDTSALKVVLTLL